jgi:hypothetical protein
MANTEFKTGDIVVRINLDYDQLKVGDVVKVNNASDQQHLTFIDNEGKNISCDYMGENFRYATQEEANKFLGILPQQYEIY